MARTIQITDGTTTLDLVNSTDMEWLYGWLPQVATPTGDGSISAYVTEEIPVKVLAATDDALAASMQKLLALQACAAEYWVEPQQATPVWFYHQLESETGQRRALVKSLRLAMTDPVGDWTTEEPSARTRTGMLYVKRHPFWESPTARTFPSASPAAGVVYAYDYTAAGGGGTPAAHDIVGDVGARIEDFVVSFGSDQNGRLWRGLRSANRHGTLANFVPTWELENGTNSPAETGVTDDAGTDPNGASPGAAAGVFVKVVETDLNWDDEWHLVMSIYCSQVTANESDQFGLFLRLLRAMVTAGTWEVQLRYGYWKMVGDADYVRGRIVEINSTSWELYATDVIPMPLRDLRTVPIAIYSGDYESEWCIKIYARRTAGAGNLYLDAIYPIPLDEGFCFTSHNTTTVAYDTSVHTGPMDNTYGLVTVPAISAITDVPQVSDASWYLPVGDGRMIIAWARVASSDFTDVPTLSTRGAVDSGTYYERWLALRGAE